LHPGRKVTENEVPLTRELAAIARQVRRVFGLDIFGVDVVRAPQGWVAVDINDFPGFGGVPEAVTLVSRHIAHLARPAAVRHALSAQGRLLLHGLGASPAPSAPPSQHAAPQFTSLEARAERAER
jgi:hypothetical protein